MKDFNNSKLSPPPLGDRMQLAKMLCRAMFDFHKAEWFHKSFSSFNILLFPESDASEHGAEGIAGVAEYSILAPYIVGFNNSRPSKPNEFSEPAKISNELNQYRHPDYKNVPMQNFRHEFDYYSLGVVLLEVGLWSPLSALLKGFGEQPADMTADIIRISLCPLLSSSIGSIYQRVVADLLNSLPEETDVADRNELTPLGTLIGFQTRTLQDLGQCRA
jgi:hypothetical protein